MHAVVNHLPIKPDTDWAEIVGKVDAFAASVTHPDYRGLSLIRTEEQDAILLVLFTSRSALDEISRTVAGPWFAENMRPYLAGAASRSVGEVVAGSLKASS
jgi:hypothetical protein